MRQSLQHWAILLAAGVMSCASGGTPAPDPHALLLSAPDGPSREVPQAIWEAVLTRYRDRRGGTSGDAVRWFQRFFQRGRGGRAPTDLLAQRDSALAPFNHDWVLSLIRRNLINGVCVATRPTDCPQQEVTTYLRLSEPEFEHEDLWKVQVLEVAVGPSVCRGASQTAEVVDYRLWVTYWVSRSGTTYQSVDSRVDARAGPNC